MLLQRLKRMADGMVNRAKCGKSYIACIPHIACAIYVLRAVYNNARNLVSSQQLGEALFCLAEMLYTHMSQSAHAHEFCERIIEEGECNKSHDLYRL